MDEAVRIYNPRGNYLVAEIPKSNLRKERVARTSVSNTAKRKSIQESVKQTQYETLCEVLDEREAKEKVLVSKYGWVNLFINWLIVAMLVLLVFSTISWVNQIQNERKVASMFATAMADFEAEQQAIEDQKAEALRAEQALEATIERTLAEPLARLYQGAAKFKDKYGYSERDFKTLGRCVFNRVESPLYSDNLLEVVNQKDQWVGYNPNAPIVNEYYQMALNHVREWRQETTKPCSNDYLWAELTPNGIFLKNDFHADGYAIRWRAD